MALSITVNGGGTFSASMEEGPVSFTATLGAVPGPKGDTGATGPTGVITATAPILYDSGTQTVSIDPDPTFNSVTANDITTSTLDLVSVIFSDNTTQTTAFVGEARKVYVTARNNTGSTIAAGKVVYLSGATGNKPTIALAQANAEATSARVIGLTVESIANNADGKVIISGSAENIDTSAFNAGDVVYLSASTAGGMTTTLPTQPNHGVAIGIITRANPSVGSVEVAINNYQELEELSDVSVADRANNDGLFWEASSSTWRSKTIAEVLGLTPIALTSLSASAPISYNSGTGAFTFDSSTFLLKADNLSGLASASTARTNLGLGTMATETAANYALLASPTFSGTPSLPTGTIAVTQAAGNNTTAVATTAFVQTSNPDASTTVKGHVELATILEAHTGSSTTLCVTPDDLAFRIHSGSTQYLTATDATASISGGTTFVSSNGVGVRSGTASGSFGMRVFDGNVVNGYSATTGSSTTVNFSRRAILSGKAQVVSAAEAGNVAQRIQFGKTQTTTPIGNLNAKGFGIRCTGGGNVVQLLVHDGTTLTSVNSSHTAAAAEAFDFQIHSDGAGNVTLYINGASVATSSAGPTGASGSLPVVTIETEATATVTTAANTAFLGSNLRVSFDL